MRDEACVLDPERPVEAELRSDRVESAGWRRGSARSTAGSPVTRINRKIGQRQEKERDDRSPSRLMMNLFIAF